jgi:serine/threonine-protein kinase
MNDGLLIGGKYRLKKLIGSGGMGQVWVAQHELTGREFAIKLLLPQAAANPEIVTRFVQEARVSALLRHSGILEIYDVGTAPELNGASFLVMELLHGVSLDVAISSVRTLPVRFALQVGVAVTRALKVAHERGIVHRDLKPANVFLHRDEGGGVVPKLLDFGISKLAPGEAVGADPLALTRSGMILGSPRYMSPEQMASQKDIDGRSDLHALGVLLWCCLVGKPPFDLDDVRTLLLTVLSDQRPRLLDARPDAPPGVAAFVSRAFARDRDRRYANAGEALAVLEEELAKLGPGPGLESRAWVEPFLAGAASPTQPVAPRSFPALADGKESMAPGAVSMSVKLSPQPASPKATTLNASIDESAFRPRTGRGLVLGGLALLVAGLLVAGGVVMYRPTGRGAVASGVGGDAALLPAAVTTQPSVSLVALDAEAPPAATATASDPRGARPAPGVRPPKHGPASAKAPPQPTAAPSDTFRGVVGTGL